MLVLFGCFLVCGLFVGIYNRLVLEVSLPARFPKEDACVERFATAKRSFLLVAKCEKKVRRNVFEGLMISDLLSSKSSAESFLHDNCSYCFLL